VGSELTGTDDTGTSDEDGMDEPAGSAVHPVNASIATANNRANAFLLADFFIVSLFLCRFAGQTLYILNRGKFLAECDSFSVENVHFTICSCLWDIK
jgi:hypothetical protein